MTGVWVLLVVVSLLGLLDCERFPGGGELRFATARSKKIFPNLAHFHACGFQMLLGIPRRVESFI